MHVHSQHGHGHDLPPCRLYTCRLFERASPANAPLEHPVRARDPAYALLERLFERALARASACASLHIEVLPAAGAA
jgi:hypothetical protein